MSAVVFRVTAQDATFSNDVSRASLVEHTFNTFLLDRTTLKLGGMRFNTKELPNRGCAANARTIGF
jgi:hypothetical protein